MCFLYFIYSLTSVGVTLCTIKGDHCQRLFLSYAPPTVPVWCYVSSCAPDPENTRSSSKHLRNNPVHKVHKVFSFVDEITYHLLFHEFVYRNRFVPDS